MSAWAWAGVALIGGGAAIARFLLDGLVGSLSDGSFPAGTLAVNLSGATVLGLLAGLGVSGQALLVAGTATIGSYTTFSTWMLESQRLVEDAAVRAAAANVLVSIVLGVAAVTLGHALGAAL